MSVRWQTAWLIIVVNFVSFYDRVVVHSDKIRFVNTRVFPQAKHGEVDDILLTLPFSTGHNTEGGEAPMMDVTD